MANDFRGMIAKIKGRRVQFAGSSSKICDTDALAYAHSVIGRLAASTLRRGGGLVVTLGEDPSHRDGGLSTIFDWTILEALARFRERGSSWPYQSGSQIVAVGFSDWNDRIPSNRRHLLQRVLKTGKVNLVQLKSGLNVGGLMREVQSSYGDLLVIAGGGPGTQHLSELYCASGKPVIPLDLDLSGKSEGKRVAQVLSKEAMESPWRFFSTSETGITASYSTLSVRKGRLAKSVLERRFWKFVDSLPPPQSFLIRVLDRKNLEFQDVEKFFREVVDDVVSDLGFRRFESGLEASKESFLNVEIFTQIAKSSLIIADATALRPNCFMEMGYAYGDGRRVILTAKEGTVLPFDSMSLPCFFWSPGTSTGILKRSFAEFISKNIDRGPLIGAHANVARVKIAVTH
jgi:hypothetical protein